MGGGWGYSGDVVTMAMAHPSPWKSLLLSAPATDAQTLRKVPRLAALPHLPTRPGGSTMPTAKPPAHLASWGAHPQLPARTQRGGDGAVSLAAPLPLKPSLQVQM